jgi:hypothetical protein
MDWIPALLVELEKRQLVRPGHSDFNRGLGYSQAILGD